MLIFNQVGGIILIVALAAGFVVGGLVDWLRPRSDKAVAFGGMAFFAIVNTADLGYRWRHFREYGWVRFVHPFTGGMFFFAPLWMFCGLLPCVGTLVLAVVNPAK